MVLKCVLPYPKWRYKWCASSSSDAYAAPPERRQRHARRSGRADRKKAELDVAQNRPLACGLRTERPCRVASRRESWIGHAPKQTIITRATKKTKRSEKPRRKKGNSYGSQSVSVSRRMQRRPDTGARHRWSVLSGKPSERELSFLTTRSKAAVTRIVVWVA